MKKGKQEKGRKVNGEGWRSGKESMKEKEMRRRLTSKVTEKEHTIGRRAGSATKTKCTPQNKAKELWT